MRVFVSLLVALAAAGEEPQPAAMCAHAETENAVWCDYKLPLEQRVDAIVSNLTLEEKAGLLVNGAAGVPRIHWPMYNWWSEALHGVARDGVGTSFPQIIGIGSSLNRSLWSAMAEVTSTEGRGKNNKARGGLYQGLTFWAPNVNIFRDPRWGRGQETPGEDPKINGEYAAKFVSGMQGQDAKYLKVSACLKHFAAYSEETGRNSFAANVTKQDMEDTYLPAFEVGVSTGKASSIMCSYNAETYGYGTHGNGSQGGAIPSCANRYLLNDLARERWGFDGYITSDCGAVSNIQHQHGYTNNAADTVSAVLQAGMDIDCGSYMGKDTMVSLLTKGDVKIHFVDAALRHLFRVQFRLGFADPPSLVPWAAFGAEVVNTAEHRALARDAAEQTFVLLKNDAGTLPLSRKPKLAVVGRNAKATQNMQGNYYGEAPFLVSPLDGLKKHAGSIVFDLGEDIANATKLVQEVDAVVLVVGLTSEGQQPADEAEGHDRSSLQLPEHQDDLMRLLLLRSLWCLSL